MGILLLILFSVMEITLVVLSCTKYRERLSRSKNKLIIRGAETVLLLCILLIPAGQKWRFVVCLVILGIRLVFSGISFAVKLAKNDRQECSKAGAVINAVWSIFVIGTALIPAFIFTGYNGLETTGQYGVKQTEAILVDSSRMEKYETDGSSREIPIHFYYPDGGSGEYPFVLFSHGSFGYYQSNTSLYMELASNGYVVASIDHPYYAFFTRDTSGNTVIVDRDFLQACIDITNNTLSDKESVRYTKEWLDVRAADENFVLDTIKAAQESGILGNEWSTENSSGILNVLHITDMGKIGLTGHSIGGAVAIKLGRERDDITAVIDIDGTMFSEKISGDSDVYVYIDEPYPIPFLEFNNDITYKEAYNSDFRTGDGSPYIDVHVLNNAADGREYHIDNTAHMDFTDLPLLSPVLAKMLGKGSADSREVIPEINRICLEFFNYYLKGEGEITVGDWVLIN